MNGETIGIGPSNGGRNPERVVAALSPEAMSARLIAEGSEWREFGASYYGSGPGQWNSSHNLLRETSGAMPANPAWVA